MLRASQLIKRLGGGGDANYHNGRVGGGFTDGVAGNAGKIRLRAESREHHDVVGFVADDDIKTSGKGWFAADPHTELGVSGNNDFVWKVFLAEGEVCCARIHFKEGVGHREGFVHRKAFVAVAGINEEQGFAGR